MAGEGGTKVFLGGEGKNEIGAQHPGATEPGVLEALLGRVRAEGWHVAAILPWRRIRKYKAGDHRTAEQRNVLGLALHAFEARCEVLAFSRDAGDVHDADASYAEAIVLARTVFPTLAVIGGLAKPTIEGWVLALKGYGKTDELSKAKAAAIVDELEILKSTAAYVEVVTCGSLDDARACAPSLDAWLAAAELALYRTP